MFCFVCCFGFVVVFFFFNDTATTEIYTLSLHDALPIPRIAGPPSSTSLPPKPPAAASRWPCSPLIRDRKSTRLNSSHTVISYAVFCLKKKKKVRHRLKSSQENASSLRAG